MVEHVDIPDEQLHEPKGIDTALAGTFYVADGAGSGSWENAGSLAAFPAYPVGAVIDFGGSTLPSGWSFCDGTSLSRSQYIDLFSIIGTTYGAGDGSTTFHIPDCRGRVSIGKDDMGGVSADRVSSVFNGDTLGQTGGAQSTTLSATHMPSSLTGTTNSTGSHSHSVSGDPIIRATGTAAGNPRNESSPTNPLGEANLSIASGGAHTHTASVNTGVTPTAHNNVQPTIIFNKIIFHGVFNT